MEKLELKHLAPYLPYDLKVKNENRTYKIITINGFYFSNSELMLNSIELNGGISSKEIKPILRPLSDLTKEIEFDENKFVPYKDLEIELDIILLILDGTMSIDNLAYSDVEYLVKWHFDVFELIPKNLAIDFNTLKNE